MPSPEGGMPKYVDYADYYDSDHAIQHDIPFYLERARAVGAPTLELACGTGRVLLPLARAGIDIAGLDSSDRMLEVCQRKLQDAGLAGKTPLFKMDMTEFELPYREYGLVFVAARSFMHLYSQADQLACLEHAFAHMRVEGSLVLDLYSPDYAMMSQDPDQPFKVTAEYDLPNGNYVIRSDRFVRNDSCLQIQYSFTKRQPFLSTLATRSDLN
jgi:SAM-dependent methyltransferase